MTTKSETTEKCDLTWWYLRRINKYQVNETFVEMYQELYIEPATSLAALHHFSITHLRNIFVYPVYMLDGMHFSEDSAIIKQTHYKSLMA